MGVKVHEWDQFQITNHEPRIAMNSPICLMGLIKWGEGGNGLNIKGQANFSIFGIQPHSPTVCSSNFGNQGTLTRMVCPTDLQFPQNQNPPSKRSNRPNRWWMGFHAYHNTQMEVNIKLLVANSNRVPMKWIVILCNSIAILCIVDHSFSKTTVPQQCPAHWPHVHFSRF